MGFFSNFIKGEVKKTFNSIAENIKNSNLYKNSSPSYDGDVRSKIEGIIASDFPEYELRKEVSASETNAAPGAKDYSYGIYLNNIPKAYIMIMEDHNHYRKAEVRLAREAAERNNIPYMNFMPYLPNEYSYVAERLKTNILR